MISELSTIDGRRSTSALSVLMPGLLALLSAVPVAFLIYLVHTALPDQTEKGVLMVGVLFAILLALPPTVYLVFRRRLAQAAELGLIVLTTAGILLVSIYLYWVSFFVLFPADILIWSEGDFVNDILKLRVGYPLYTAQVNNESFTYTPGAQALTYALAWLSGNATSIPTYRAIQVGYTVLAAIVAALCCRKLVLMSLPAQWSRSQGLWGAVWLPILFLIATNSVTNPFTHLLHNDALAQLVSTVAYWLLLRYVTHRENHVAVLMALVPTIGFLTKQSLIIWAGFYCLYLALFDRPRSLARLVAFAVAAFGTFGVCVAGGFLLWGEHFVYWVFTVLGAHGVSPLKAFDHLLQVWAHVAIGLVGGAVLVRGKCFDRLLGPWIIGLSVILLNTYTSGVDGMLNHIGPGSLIVGIWFLAALARIWPLLLRPETRKFKARIWLRAGIALAVINLLSSGLGLVRIPLNPVSADVYRYVEEIEAEFEGQRTEDVLLDMGTWVYMAEDVIMKDRAPSIGERGYSQTGDFSGILQRLEGKHYSKILVRSLHSPELYYDYWIWSKSSGIRQAMLDNYRETRRIAAVNGTSYQPRGYFFSEISVLVPREDSAP